MDSITIRPAIPEDAPAIYSVLDAAFSPYKDQYPIEAYNATVISEGEARERIISKEAWVFVVLLNDEIVGTVSLKMKPEDDLYIYTMAVLPSFQGKGIGKMIYNKIVETAQENKCRSISLETTDPLVDTFKFYTKMGFRRSGKQREYHGIYAFEMRTGIEE